ncbi:MAG: DNA polymerase III subunit gamma/tau [Bacteriovoracaceae bacterium]
MSYQVLARKWRPKQFSEVIGQTHVTRSLQNSLVNKKIGHAYLFTGTRGVGKTTVARIFAKAIRCVDPKIDGNPCLVCSACTDIDSGSSMDFIEIDGASNNSVDNIRNLVDNVQYLPTQGEYKVYVIDEVHMLSTQAFNALLKTLEEPPKHVVFIFATTEVEKLLGTVLSRCQRFDFRHVNLPELEAHVKKICDVEVIKFQNPKILTQICLQGKGSVRDTLSLLDQVLSFSVQGQITDEALTVSLGLARTSAIRDLLTYLLLGESKKLSETFRTLIYENVDLKNLASSLLNSLFDIIQTTDNPVKVYQDDLLQAKTLDEITTSELFWIFETLTKDFEWALRSLDPVKVCEVILLKVTLRRSFFDQKKNEPTLRVFEEELRQAPKAPRFQSSTHAWDLLLQHLFDKAPATAANLEQGNILENFNLEDESPLVRVGFPASGHVFFDYLSDKDVQTKLIKEMEEFFCLIPGSLKLNLNLLKESKNLENFRTKIEIEVEKQEEHIEGRKKQLTENPFVQEAENLFKMKIDKIILNDEK